jgi:hypothetical protein
MSSPPPDLKPGMTDFPPEHDIPADKLKASRFWKYCLVGCSGIILILVIISILAIIYINRHKVEMVNWIGRYAKNLIAASMDPGIPKDKKDELNISIDDIVKKFSEGAPDKRTSNLIEQLEPFFSKLNNALKDERINEQELDEMLLELRKSFPKPSESPGEPVP